MQSAPVRKFQLLSRYFSIFDELLCLFFLIFNNLNRYLYSYLPLFVRDFEILAPGADSPY